jgi:hypothetical protein
VSVNFLRAALSGEVKQRRQAMAIAMVLAAVGIIVIVVGEIADWGWTRVIGATLISVGGVGIGVLTGLIPTRREAMLDWLRRWRTVVVVLAVVVLVLPILVALAAGVIGAFTGGGGTAALKVTGALISLLMFAAVAASAWIGVQATLRATRAGAEIALPEEDVR